MLSNKKFLLIDDSKTVIAMMRSMLLEVNVCNSNIDSTVNSHKAIRLLANNNYDVVLCDYNMGDHIDGALIFDEVKQRKLIAANAVFICITGDNSLQAVTHFIELEPDDYLLKPFRSFEFIERVERELLRKKMLAPLLQAVQEHNYQRALDLCADYRKNFPQYLNYLNRIYGDCLLRLQRHEEARLFYKNACKHTEHVWPQIGFGQALQGLGEYLEAEDVFRKILVEHPTQPIARRSLAEGMMLNNKIPEALEQFKLLHKINPANPLRELVIANLYATLRQYEQAAFAYRLFINKVSGTNRYSFAIAANIVISLLLTGLYSDDKQKKASLLNEARLEINGLKASMEEQGGDAANEPDLLACLGILACMSGNFKSCFVIASKIKSENAPINDFYTALNIAQLYAFCGMSDLYEKCISLAKQFCGKTTDTVLLQSQIKLLAGSHDEVRQRLKDGQQYAVSSLALCKNNCVTAAVEDAYKAFFMVPFYFKLCFLILELMGRADSFLIKKFDEEGLLESCFWIYEHDSRPTQEEKIQAQKFFNLAKKKAHALA